MTPKEKAHELVEKMNVIHYIKLGGKNSKRKGLPVSMHNSQSIQCAIMAVDEILNLEELIEWDFWSDVKQEIEKL